MLRFLRQEAFPDWVSGFSVLAQHRPHLWGYFCKLGEGRPNSPDPLVNLGRTNLWNISWHRAPPGITWPSNPTLLRSALSPLKYSQKKEHGGHALADTVCNVLLSMPVFRSPGWPPTHALGGSDSLNEAFKVPNTEVSSLSHTTKNHCGACTVASAGTKEGTGRGSGLTLA